VVIVGAGIIFNIIGDISGPLQSLTWTGLIRNGLNYLINENYVDAVNNKIKRIKNAFKNINTDNLLDAANILIFQLIRHRQFSIWLESVFGNLYYEIKYSTIIEMLKTSYKKKLPRFLQLIMTIF
jgi:hypothetical protein